MQGWVEWMLLYGDHAGRMRMRAVINYAAEQVLSAARHEESHWPRTHWGEVWGEAVDNHYDFRQEGASQ